MWDVRCGMFDVGSGKLENWYWKVDNRIFQDPLTINYFPLTIVHKDIEFEKINTRIK